MLVNQATLVFQVMKYILYHYILKKVRVIVTCSVLCKGIYGVKVSEICKRSLIQHIALTVTAIRTVLLD
jgi:hypothetical protein